MQEHLKQEPKSLQKALEQKEQLEARIANERSKYAADLRTAQSRHKHMIGGAVVKYFPGVYHFDEAEVNEIIMSALATRECLKTIKTIERRNQSAESYTDDIIKRVSDMRESMNLPNTVPAVEAKAEEQGAGNGAFQKRDGGDDNG